MSPALKSKTKNKVPITEVKEKPKAPLKPSSSAGNGGNVLTNAYNPISGTFHNLETGSAALLQNDKIIVVDDIDNRYGTFFVGAEFDSKSNNDSCSGESEDHKDKIANPSPIHKLEPIPGCDNDKREKIRQKNEKKHQRQKERRAQELHERCIGFLMSRKLDSLTEKLVGMGFATEHATRALMLNDGRVEDSVSWLLEGGMEEETESAKSDGHTNLKIDISEELGKVSMLELKFRCSKQDAERAVVSCEGNLERAEELLKSQKLDQAGASSKLVKSSDITTVPTNGNGKMVATSQNPMSRMTSKAASSSLIPSKRDERDTNYMKSVPIIPPISDLRSRTSQPSMKMQSKTDWLKNMASQNDRALASMVPSSSVSASSAVASSSQVVAPAKIETPHAINGNENKTKILMGPLKEPVIVMQRPQSVNMIPNPPSTSVGVSVPPQFSVGWNPNLAPTDDMIKTTEGGMQNFPTASNPQSLYHGNHQSRPFDMALVETSRWGSSSWNHGRNPLTAPSSLGLFTGWNHVGSSRSSSLDWNMIGSTLPEEFDYTSIDWSMDLSSHSLLRSDQQYESWPTTFTTATVATRNMTPGGFPLEYVDFSGIFPMDR